MVNILLLLVCLLGHSCLPAVEAYPTQAGSCRPAGNAVDGPHLYQPQVGGGHLSKYGLKLRIGGHALQPGKQRIELQVGTEYDIDLVATYPETFFRGFLLRLESLHVDTTSALYAPAKATDIQVSDVCVAVEHVGGLTHTGRHDKTHVRGKLRLDEPVSELYMDVTVVVRNNFIEGASEWYYSGFVLNVTAPLSQFPSSDPTHRPSTLSPFAGPTSSPSSSKTAMISYSPSATPTGAPTIMTSATPTLVPMVSDLPLAPTTSPTHTPSLTPTTHPTSPPTTGVPSQEPTANPSSTASPSSLETLPPTLIPSEFQTTTPTRSQVTSGPSLVPTSSSSSHPSIVPTMVPAPIRTEPQAPIFQQEEESSSAAPSHHPSAMPSAVPSQAPWTWTPSLSSAEPSPSPTVPIHILPPAPQERADDAGVTASPTRSLPTTRTTTSSPTTPQSNPLGVLPTSTASTASCWALQQMWPMGIVIAMSLWRLLQFW